MEQNPLAVSCIQDNLETTHLKERALIMKKDVLLALKELEGKERRQALRREPKMTIGKDRVLPKKQGPQLGP